MMTVQDYFKHFDKTFNTDISNNIDIDKFPMLKLAYAYMAEIFNNLSEDKKIITHNLGKIEKELLSTFNDNQRELFEQYEEAENISVTEICRQMLVFGYSMAYQELKEMNALK